jgi:hypothetical protein
VKRSEIEGSREVIERFAAGFLDFARNDASLPHLEVGISATLMVAVG